MRAIKVREQERLCVASQLAHYYCGINGNEHLRRVRDTIALHVYKMQLCLQLYETLWGAGATPREQWIDQ